MARPESTPRARGTTSRSTAVTQDDVVRVALELATTNGLEALSIRGVAAAVGLAPMSVYKFVESKDELLDAMVLRVLDRMEIPYSDATDWRERIVEIISAWANLLESQPCVVQILVDRRIPAGSPGLGRLAEHILTALEQGGIIGAPATRAFWQIFSLAFGHIVFRRARAGIDTARQAVARDEMRATAIDHGFTHVVTAAEDLTTIGGRGTLADAVRVLVRGLASQTDS